MDNQSDVLHPSFSLEDQEVAAQLLENRTVVGPPGYASPDPATQGGRLVPVEDHPLVDSIDADYGGSVASPSPVSADGERDEDDRDNWSRQDWIAYADELGVGSSGSAKVIRERVERYEASQDEDDES
jgi:hypothetical protein